MDQTRYIDKTPGEHFVGLAPQVAGPLLLAYGLLRWHQGLFGTRGPGMAWETGHLALLGSQVAMGVTLVRWGFRPGPWTVARRAVAIIGVVGGLTLVAQTVVDLVVGLVAHDRSGMTSVYSAIEQSAAGPVLDSPHLPALLPVSLLAMSVLRWAAAPSRGAALRAGAMAGFVVTLSRVDWLPLAGILLWCALNPRPVRLSCVSTCRFRRSWIARIMWLGAAVVFFGGQVWAAAGWHHPAFSWSWNNVSDLGHLSCRPWAEDGHGPTFVCSPRHTVMNTAFVVSGLLVGLGAVFQPLWSTSLTDRLARAGFVLVGLGLMVSGWVPADLDKHVHQGCGALIVFVGSAMGLACTATGRRGDHRVQRGLAGVCCGVSLLGFAAFVTGHSWFLGPGGMERVWGFSGIGWAVLVLVPRPRK